MSQVRLLFEGLPERQFIEGILRPELDADQVQMERGWGISDMMGKTELSFLRGGRQPTVLVLNAETDDDLEIKEEILDPVSRVLSRVPTNLWHLAVAIPDLCAWAAADPRIAQAFADEEVSAGGPRKYVDRAAQFAELTKQEAFNRAAAASAFAEFQQLLGFLRCHAPDVQVSGPV